MAYTCQNCGATDESSNNLCKPTEEAVKNKFCGSSVLEVCNEQLSTMQYTCDSCGSVSAQSDNLCNPRKLR